MNRKSLAVILVGVAVLGGVAWADTYDLSWNTIDGGGAMFSTGGAFSLGGTIGQPDAQTPPVMSGGSFALTGGFWAATDVCPMLGDINGDGVIDGQDVQLFVNCLLGSNGTNCGCADFNGGGVSSNDVPLFVAAVLGP
jgi:hypothetical protein